MKTQHPQHSTGTSAAPASLAQERCSKKEYYSIAAESFELRFDSI